MPREKREKGGKRVVPPVTGVLALLCGFLFYFAMIVVTLGPAAGLLPQGISFIIQLMAVWLVPASIALTVLTLVARPKQGAIVLVCLVAGFWVMRWGGAQEDALWLRRFKETAAQRAYFIIFMTGQREEYIDLPSALRGLSDQPYAIRHVDEQGHTFFAYTAYTHGIDNGVGFVWSESGLPPPRLAYPEIMFTKSLGGGWYLFRST